VQTTVQATVPITGGHGPCTWEDGHQWVAAALVGMGRGDTRRAEHAARTGKHVLASRTRIRVLEVYCAECRIGYSERASALPCRAVTPRTA
jgi:hypothetical protein